MAPHPGIAVISKDLVALGFRKRAGYIHTMDVDVETIGWLALGWASQKYGVGRVHIWSNIGVRSQAAERIIAEVSGRTFHQYLPPTVMTPVRYLVPEGRRED